MAYIIFLFVIFSPNISYADPVTAGVTAALVSAGVGATTAAAIAGAITSFLGSVVLTGLSAVLGGKPKKRGSLDQGITQSFREAIAERRIVYGEKRVSGSIVFLTTTLSNKYFHYVIPVASHEVEAIDEVFINDISIPVDALDASGFVNSGRYLNKVRIKKHLGTPTQAADSDLVSEVGEWTSAHQLKSIAYMYIRLEWDRDVFPNGIPNISAVVRGAKILDTRDSVTRYSPNIALQAHDYLTDTRYGIGSSDVSATYTTTAANTCDEMVTTANIDVPFTDVDTVNDIITVTSTNNVLELQRGDRVSVTSGSIGGISGNVYVIPFQRSGTTRIQLASSLANAIAGTAISLSSGTTGTITKNAEPRYHGGGVVTWGEEPNANLQDILSGMAGSSVDTGGSRFIYAGAYQTPTIIFDKDDLVGEIVVQTGLSKTESFNTVQGVYSSSINLDTPTDYPAITNATYITEDGETIRADLELPFTTRPHTAQRLAKIALERSRQEIIFTASFKLTAFKVQCGDNFYFDFPRYGWSNKVFEVMSWELSIEYDNESNPIPVVKMICRENASGVYDWNSGEETQVDPAPNTLFPSPFDVDPVTGISVVPVEISTASGDLTYKFTISWTPPVDEFVTSGGRYEVQFKKSSDAIWQPSFFVDGEQTSSDVNQVQPAINYDVRIRAYNSLNARSNFSNLFGFTVSSPSGATIALDYGSITKTPSQSLDYGSITGDASENEIDYGDLI